MMLKPILVTPPAAPLVTLDQAKAHCRVDHNEENDLLDGLMLAATAWLDGYSGVMGRALINQTWRINLSSWPACRVRLPLAPVSVISSIKYQDAADEEQTLNADNWSLHEDALSPFAHWTPSASLPSLYERPDAIAVEFVAGYGASASNVPAAIIHAAKMLIGHLYEQRETAVVGTTAQELPFAVSALISPFRRVSF